MEIKKIKFGFHSFAWGEHNFIFAPNDLSKMRFEYMELYGKHIDKINQMQQILIKTHSEMGNVKLTSVFYDENFEKKIDKNRLVAGLKKMAKETYKPLGVQNLILTSGTYQKDIKNNMEYIAEMLNTIALGVKEFGLNVLLQPQQDRFIFDKKSIDDMMKLVDTDFVKLCPDTAQLKLANIKFDDFLKEYKELIGLVHFSDLSENNESVNFGTGTIDIKEMVQNLVDVDYDGVVIICSPKNNMEEVILKLRDAREQIENQNQI